MTYRRLTDNDTRIGPFIVLGKTGIDYRPVGFSLDSGDSEYPGCSLNFQAFGFWLQIAVPQLIKPWRQWVDLRKYDWAHSNGYWDVHARKYGFSLSDGFMQVFYGQQTHDSSTDKVWCKHLPWTEWRFVRFILYDVDGKHFWSQLGNGSGARSYEEQRAQEERVPKVRFKFIDYDGDIIEATTHIEEREWLRGDKWCKWLSFFYAPKVVRSLDIEFSKEVGPKKGSWKGGVMWTGINMLPGELHEGAFARYCLEHNLREPRVLEGL